MGVTTKKERTVEPCNGAVTVASTQPPGQESGSSEPSCKDRGAGTLEEVTTRRLNSGYSGREEEDATFLISETQSVLC